MIDIELRLFGDFRQYLDVRLGEGFNMKIKNGSTIRKLIVAIGIPIDDVKIILVNGRSKDFDDMLFDGDRLAIFPPIAGG